MTSRFVSLCAQRCSCGRLMRCLRALEDTEDDKYGKVWLAKNAGWLEGVGCGFGGDDALAVLIEPDTYDIDETDAEHKALRVRAKACIGFQLDTGEDEYRDNEGLAILHQCADADDWFAALSLGTEFLFETDDPHKHSEGMKLLEKAVQLGSGYAMFNIGTVFGRGISTEIDQNLAQYWWQRAAEYGVYNAYASLGQLYCYPGIDADKSQGFLFCAVAADAGIPLALRNVGICYEKGIGVVQNQQKAFEFYNKAYCASHEGATVSALARCLIQGIGTKQDVKKGMELLNEGVKANDPSVISTLGQFLVSGKFIERDEERGTELLKLAAEMGNMEAKAYFTPSMNKFVSFEVLQQNKTIIPYMKFTGLGIFYLDDERVKNPELAFENFKRGVQECQRVIDSFDSQNLEDGQQDENLMLFYGMSLSCLGKCYQDGIGTTVNQEEAIKCYERGVSLNCSSCMCGLAECYEKGIGVKQDEKKAFELFKHASDLDDDNGVLSLARCYENGIGVEVNLPQAMELYHHLSSFGNLKAKERLEAISQRVPEQ